MADVTQQLQDLDRRFEAAITQGTDLNTLPILDWETFARGYAQRNVIRTDARRMRSLVGEKIVSAVWSLNWDLPHLVKWSYHVFSYDQVQKNLSLLSLFTRLEADGLIYLAAQEALRAEANKSADAPTVAQTQKYYDDWDYCYDSGVRKPSEWDIREVNGISEGLANLITYLTLFGTEAETGTDPHNFAQVCVDALPEVQAFQAYFPTFCALLNEANILNLTEKVIVKEPVELNLQLPEVASAERSINLQPIARVQTNQSVDEFQGFAIFIALEPRSAEEIAADKRDLHGNFISKEEIRKAAIYWSIHGRKNRIEHDPGTEVPIHENPDWCCVFNWIQHGDAVIGSKLVKDGTWLQAYQALTDDAKTKLQNYEINGLSPGGISTFWRDPEETED